MDELVLRLLPDNQEPQELVLQQHQLANSILDTANATSSYVFSDYKYRAQLVNIDERISNLVFLLNGKNVEINYSPENGMIAFQDFSFGQRIFLECYGFAQITIAFDDEQGNRQIRETEYIQVMVRKGRQNESVRRMTEYVYKQDFELLNGGRTLPKDASGLKESARKTIESHMLLLEQISVIYEENYRYFKMNCRFSTIPKERVDHFEKLQYVSSNTMQYIARHPEELQKIHHFSGIRVGNFRYQPNKTLITNNEKSYDTYENHITLGFLLLLLHEVERIQKELADIVNRIPPKPMETNDYVASSYFIYSKTVESVKLLLQDIRKLHRKYTSLYYLYADILSIKAKALSALPRFTPVFKSIPQYHQIYDCAIAWFTKGVFAIREEQFMLSFIKISALYEIYVLTKLINYFCRAGYARVSAEKITYPSPGKYYENTDGNNRFIFQSDAGRITLYYQPVIYNTNRDEVGGIGLYRNTSISYPKSEDAARFGGGYYTPDFLIKYEYSGSTSAKYLIADAKFSRLHTVKSREVPELAYKYLFSISPVAREDQIVGLCIFNGQSDVPEDSYTNIYDFELAQRITPRADIVTLTENAENNLELHEALFRNTVGLYVTEAPQKPAPIPATAKPQPQEISPVQPERPAPAADSAVAAGESDTFKKAARKKRTGTADLNLSELKLDKDVEKRLLAAGYITLGDLIPNQSKSDLTENAILNRKSRREIEAKLKQRRVRLE